MTVALSRAERRRIMEEKKETIEVGINARTSSNNMLCIVDYKPMTAEEQAQVEEALAI